MTGSGLMGEQRKEHRTRADETQRGSDVSHEWSGPEVDSWKARQSLAGVQKALDSFHLVRLPIKYKN